MTLNSLGALDCIVEIADRFESAWRQGLRPRIEAFLDEGPPAHRAELLHDLLRIELELRRERGESPDVDEYAGRFPLDRELVDAAFSNQSDQSGLPRSDEPPSLEATMPIVPGYRFVRLVGVGGFSEVWLAEDENLFHRPVALKMIRARTPPEKRRILLDALRSEAELLVSVHHPNLVQVLRWLDSPEEAGLVLQYIPGGSLADRLGREGPLDWRSAARYVADVAEGLVAAHRAGIIHRDVKPANILWDSENDEAVLTDLGVGARLGEPASTGGTIPYMAPEAFQGRTSPTLDVYGLAATLFTLVTGQKPFSGTTISELCHQVNQGLPDPDPRCDGLPEPLERIVRRGLAADPELRPGLEEFVRTLRGTLNQLLADSLMMKPRPPVDDATTERVPGAALEPSPVTTEPEISPHPPVDLRLIVSRQVGPNKFVAIAATREPAEVLATRDMKKVPPPPNQVRLRTGDRVRIEAVCDRHGFITVFNVGPTGNLSLLYPDEPQPAGTFTAPILRANQTLQVMDVELTPPAGRERLFAVWSRQPLPLRLERLQSLVESKGKRTPTSRPYVATRDMKRVQQSVEGLPPEDWKAVSVQLDHAPREPDPGDGSPA
jgi:serine/threonine protein kinase